MESIELCLVTVSFTCADLWCDSYLKFTSTLLYFSPPYLHVLTCSFRFHAVYILATPFKVHVYANYCVWPVLFKVTGVDRRSFGSGTTL